MKKFVLLIIVIFLLVVWGSMFWFMVKYARDLRQHPCQFCAKRIGSEVSCTTAGVMRTYFPNGSYQDIRTNIPVEEIAFDFSLLNFTND